jgi:hypothetical protein
VVVFRSPQKQGYVVHRVVSVHSQGVRTRGDNNTSIDPWVLCAGDIIGRVVSAQRKNRTITIHGGMPGRILAWTLWTVKRINMAIFRILRPVYRYLAQSGIFSRLMAHRIRTHVLYFKRPNGTEMQLLMGQWVIGRCPPGKEQWHIRRPFRLFVDEASLPRVSSGSTTVKLSE